MLEKVVKNENSKNSVENSVKNGNLIPFKPGHPKLGGKQKGWKSVKTVTREILQELACEKKDMSKVTFLQAMLYKQVEVAIKERDLETFKFILELAGELINNGNI